MSPSAHLTDENLISSLYLPGNGEAHIAACAQCAERRIALQRHREEMEGGTLPDPHLSFEAQMAHRRRVYDALSHPVSIWDRLGAPRWVSAAAMVAVLAGGLVVYQRNHAASSQDDRISDAQLAQEVSQLSQGPEASSTAPLQELFE